VNLHSASRLLYTVHALFFCGFSSLAQPHSDSLTHPADSYPVDFYKQKLGPSAKIFNGREYKPYRAARDETPYLFLQWTIADLEYDGQLYGPVPILFDLSSSAVVINYRGGFLQLVKEKLSQFTVKGRKFVFLHPAGLSAGFYELLYDGNSKVYSLRQKQFKERITGMEIIREFEEQVRFYVMIANELHSIKSKKDLLELFPNQIQAVKTYIRKNNLRFKKHFESDLIAVSMYCDRLE